MTLEALRCFCAVAEVGNFRAAAERVHRSQPAVSQQIKALERETGHVLFERRRRALTPAGRALYERARRLLSDSDALERELRDFDEAATGELRLGASDTTTLYFLPPYVKAFAKAMPRTRLVIVNRPTEAVAELVLRGDIDLGITTLPIEHGELVERELFRQELVLVTPKRRRLGHGGKVNLADLRDERFLLLDAHTRTGTLLRDHFRQEGFEPQVVMDSGSFEVIKRYVAEGIGLSFLPRSVVTAADRGLAVTPVQGLPVVRIGAIWRRGAYRSKGAAAFLRALNAE
ncbi:MAG: LysR family transcriptional regulator [Candidatus Hydrogenedentes bacterium]|nr:LysR family transcriptional regulator [Candidatus Hydrogenedentota bacterium]